MISLLAAWWEGTLSTGVVVVTQQCTSTTFITGMHAYSGFHVGGWVTSASLSLLSETGQHCFPCMHACSIRRVGMQRPSAMAVWVHGGSLHRY